MLISSIYRASDNEWLNSRIEVEWTRLSPLLSRRELVRGIRNAYKSALFIVAPKGRVGRAWGCVEALRLCPTVLSGLFLRWSYRSTVLKFSGLSSRLSYVRRVNTCEERGEKEVSPERVRQKPHWPLSGERGKERRISPWKECGIDLSLGKESVAVSVSSLEKKGK